MQKLPSVFVWSGALFLIASVIFGWIAGPLVIQSQITKLTRLKNGSYVWDKWKNPKNEMYLRVYFFNVTNPKEIEEEGATPIFQELGPYVYEQRRHKENIVYNDWNDTLHYTQPLTYYFREDLSKGLSPEDMLTMISIPLVEISIRLNSYNSWVQYMLGLFLEQYEEPLFLKRTVREMMFDGYPSDMVDELQSLTGDNFFPNGQVGILVGRNGTHEGVYEVYSGIKDAKKFGEVASYNWNSKISAWPEPCSNIKGSDGSLFPAFLTKDTVLQGFHHDACRTVYLTYKEEVEYDGISGYRFEPPEMQYYSAKRNPENRCFCPDANENLTNCFEDGVYSGSGCHRGGPITLSQPHFLYAPYYLNKTIGLSPDKDKHGLFLDVEPNTGLVLRASRRMQINVDLKPNTAMEAMKSVPEMQFPILWAEETFLVDNNIYPDLLSPLFIVQALLQYGRWVCLAASLIVLAGSIIVSVMRARKKPHIYS